MAFGLFKRIPDMNMNEVFQATDTLAKKTCSMGIYLVAKQKASLLNTNELTRVDAVIFATFLNNLVISSAAKTRNVAMQVLDRYVSFVRQILEEDGGCFDDDIPSSTISKMFENRYSFYAQIMQSKPNTARGLAAIMEEFEYIIKTDIIEGKYTAFSSHAPLPVLGLEKDKQCQIEVANFPTFVRESLDVPMKSLLKLIQ